MLLHRKLVAQARARLGWSQDELADATGIKRRSISEFESGANDPKLSIVQTISDVLAGKGIVYVPATADLEDTITARVTKPEEK